MESSSKKKAPSSKKDKPKAAPLISHTSSSKPKPSASSTLFTSLNCNTNIFSQLSSLYSSQEKEKDSITSNSALFFTNFDPEIQRILHSLSKRSEITKLKALSELQDAIKARKDNESFFEAFLPTWTYLYQQIITCEYDKRLLEEANQLLGLLGSLGRKPLKTHFKELFPFWFLSMNDPNNEVSLAARKGFDGLFPLDKRAQVMSLCGEALLKNLGYFLNLDIPKILEENNALNENQAFEILDRLTVATCSSLGESLIWNKESPKSKEFLLSFKKTLELDKESVGLIKILEVLENKKKGLRSRAAVLDLIAELYTNLDPETDFPNQALSITKAVFFLIDEKERVLQQSLWKKALIVVLRKTPDFIWKKVLEGKHKEVLMKRILDCCKNAASGIGLSFYENLSTFLSLIPFGKFKGESNEETLKGRLSFIRDFMEAIWKGLAHEEARFFSERLVSSYFECLYFLCLKRFPDLSISNKLEIKESVIKYSEKIRKGLIRIPLEDFLNNSLNNSLNNKVANPYKSIPMRLAEFGDNIAGNINDKNEFSELIVNELFNTIYDTQKTMSFSEGSCIILKEFLKFLSGTQNLNIILKKAIENLLVEDFHENLKLLQKEFSSIGAFSTITIETLAGKLKLLYLILKEIKNFKDILTETLIQALNLPGLLKIITDILSGILENLTKIYKIHDCERLSVAFSRVLHISLEITSFLSICTEEREALAKLLLEKFPLIEGFDTVSSNNYLILLTTILSNRIGDSLFTDYHSLNESPSQQEALIRTGLDSPTESLSFIKESLLFKDLSMKYIAGFYQRKGLGLVMIPCVLGLLKMEVGDIGRLEELVLFAMKFCSEIKGLIKLKEIFIVWSYLLISLDDNEGKALIVNKLFKVFLQALIKGYSNRKTNEFVEVFYEIIRILAKKANDILEMIIKLAFEAFSQGIEQGFEKGLLDSICDFLEFLKTSHKKREIHCFFHEVLLQPLKFHDALRSKGIWMILKASITIIEDSIELIDILSYKDLLFEKPRIVALLLSASDTYALFRDLKLRRYYQETFREQLIGFFSEGVRLIPVLEELVKAAEEKSLIFLNGLRFLMRNFTEAYYGGFLEGYITKSIEFEEGFMDIEEKSIDLLLRKSLIAKTLLIQTKASSIKELLIDQILEKMSYFKPETANRKEALLFLLQLDFLVTVQPFQKRDLFTSDELIEKTLKFFFSGDNISIFNQINPDILHNFLYGVLFEFLNLIIESRTFVVLIDCIASVESSFKACIEYNRIAHKYYARSLISCNQFLRKIMGFLEAFSPEFKGFIIKELLNFLDDRLYSLESEKQEEIILDESNENMVLEFAETISRFSLTLSKEINEKVLYNLIMTPYPSIQKSAFSLLKQYNQNLIEIAFVFDEEGDSLKEIKRLFPENLIDKLQELSDEMGLNEELINPNTYSYFLIWVGVIVKIGIGNINNDSMKRLLKDFLEKKQEIYYEFLNNCFKGLKSLDPELLGLKTEAKGGLALELMKLEVEWSEFLSRESLLKLIIQALYLFSVNFPSFLRRWAEGAEKRFLKTADFYLKGYVSPALFLAEIETIEMRQQGFLLIILFTNS